MIAYASESECIIDAINEQDDWQELEIPPLTMLTCRHETLKEWQSYPLTFVCQERKGVLTKGVKHE